MIKELKIGGIKWIDAVGLKQDEIKDTLKKYNVHELDIEACIEGNQKARIDNYDDYSFIIFHFPKYNPTTKVYEINEFNIFLGKNFLITFRQSTGSHINKIIKHYDDLKVSTRKKDIKVSSGYILYEITQAMLEKMFRVIKKNNGDIRQLEQKIFDGDNDSFLVKDIMIKKRNIIKLKHMFAPQIYVLNHLEQTINTLYKGEIEVYFEDLEDKLGQIVNEINTLQEYIESIEDAFKSMVDIKTNFIIKVLTVFSAFLLPLTLITSFYGMNIDLPYADHPGMIFLALAFSMVFMMIIYFILKRSGKF